MLIMNPTEVNFINFTALPPSSVDFSATGHFIDEHTQNVILSRVSSIEVYSVSVNGKLFLVERIPLFDEISSLNTIKRPGRSLDSILVSFRPAKVFSPFSRLHSSHYTCILHSSPFWIMILHLTCFAQHTFSLWMMNFFSSEIPIHHLSLPLLYHVKIKDDVQSFPVMETVWQFSPLFQTIIG